MVLSSKHRFLYAHVKCMCVCVYTHMRTHTHFPVFMPKVLYSSVNVMYIESYASSYCKCFFIHIILYVRSQVFHCGFLVMFPQGVSVISLCLQHFLG